LRDRDGYEGEIRVIGDYILDQMPYMRRVGIDAFQVDDPIRPGWRDPQLGRCQGPQRAGESSAPLVPPGIPLHR
jgi:uncharacterized protein (DUF934 family)